ncbi:MAG: hypothetical protein R3D80_13185 [Paracoccaceae bacterium]
MPVDTIAILGFASGALAASSTLPENIATLRGKARKARSPRQRLRMKILRNATLSTANGGWVLYGTMSEQLPIQLFCGTTFVLAGALAFQQARQLRDLSQPKAA